MTKMLTTRWALPVVLAEFACQLEERGVVFEMCWAPRGQHAQADAITNNDTHWLRKENEVKVVLSKLPFILLTELLEQGGKFYENFEAVNTEHLEIERKSKVPLRVRGPCDV